MTDEMQKGWGPVANKHAEPECGTCKWMDVQRCRRLPPVFSKDGLGNWPYVRSDDWCGEYREKTR